MNHTYSASSSRQLPPATAATRWGLLAFAVTSLLAFFALTGAFTENASPAAPPPAALTAAAPLTLRAQENVTEVVTKALAFRDLLTASQQATLQLDFTEARAQAWSNLPCGAQCRNGIEFTNLSAEQLTAALAVIAAAADTTDGEGYVEFNAIRAADEALNELGANGYGEDMYFIAFLNEPSTTAPWMLQYGGHHYAANIAFNAGNYVGVTPHFQGVEPLTFTVDGVDYAPMQEEHDALTALLDGLSDAQRSTAELSQTFNDVLLGPDEDGNFPTTKVGVQASTLDDAQRQLIMDAIDPWLNDFDSTTAATLRGIYEDELADTYVAYSGGADLNAHGDYARIDGPSVWIEFVCQNGIVIRNQIHYHSIYRDHSRDYGNYLSSTTLGGDTTSTSLFSPVLADRVSTFPNPATGVVYLNVRQPLREATVTVFDLTGREVLRRQGVSTEVVKLDVNDLSRGTYLVRIEDGNGHLYTGKFQK